MTIYTNSINYDNYLKYSYIDTNNSICGYPKNRSSRAATDRDYHGTFYEEDELLYDVDYLAVTYDAE